MKHKYHLLIIDPTAFRGGSKIATESILRLVNCDKIRLTVLSADPDSWQWPQLNRVRLYQPQWLAQKEQGILYFVRHLFIAFNVLIARLRFGRIDIGIGASGPGVDLSLYLVSALLNFKIVQLIHGPVACSRTIARCLLSAQQVYYLASSKKSLLNCLSSLQPLRVKLVPRHFQKIHNGISEACWPSYCQQQQPIIFWAASLLKWKGLPTLVGALQTMPEKQRPATYICYIKPKDSLLPVSELPQGLSNVSCYENPSDLDQLRASANIFVSTSHNEPFGLSILEAMAAGQCVVIPADGAYWDVILEDNVNCIKYLSGDSHDLRLKLLQLSHDLPRVIRLGQQASIMAFTYRASKRYANIQTYLEQNCCSGGRDETAYQS